MTTITSTVMPSATPSDDDIAAWNALPRDEQVKRMQLALSHPDCSKPTTYTMADISALAAKLRPADHA